MGKRIKNAFFKFMRDINSELEREINLEVTMNSCQVPRKKM